MKRPLSVWVRNPFDFRYINCETKLSVEGVPTTFFCNGYNRPCIDVIHVAFYNDKWQITQLCRTMRFQVPFKKRMFRKRTEDVYAGPVSRLAHQHFFNSKPSPNYFVSFSTFEKGDNSQIGLSVINQSSLSFFAPAIIHSLGSFSNSTLPS